MKLFSRKINTGILPDERPLNEKLKDFTVDEVLPVKGINIESLPTEVKGYSLRNQNGSGSCVSQSIAKMFEILDDKSEEVYSATPIYSKRINRPQAGMVAFDALNISVKQGTAYEKVIQSQNMTDSQMDSLEWKEENLVTDKPSNYFIISNVNQVVDFEKLVNSILTYKTAVIFINASVKEWNRMPEPHKTDGTLRHGVACVGVIQHKNKPYVIIEDSWGVLNKYYNRGGDPDLIDKLKDGQRALSQEFIEKHCYFAGSFVNFIYKKTVVSPYKFTKKIEFGEKSDEVIKLQDKLKSLGLFPKSLPSTGYYGQITANSVYAFQIRYNVAPLSELNFLKGKLVGDKTIKALNKA